MKYIIIDDEPIAHRIIEGFAESMPNMEKMGNCYNAFEALSMLRDEKVDLMFLDLNMPKLKGFDFLKTLKNPPLVIVTTAYSEYALEGFDYNVVDYLLKPYSIDRFVKAINKTAEILEKLNISVTTLNQDVEKNGSMLFLKGDKKHHQINPENILYIEAYGNYAKLYIDESFVLIHEKISMLETLLSNYMFLRIHKSFLVSIQKIQTLENNIIHIGSHRIPIGQTYRNTVKGVLNIK